MAGATRIRFVALAVVVIASVLGSGGAARAVPFSSALRLDGVDDLAVVADSASVDVGVAEGADFTAETFFAVPDETNTSTDTLFWKQGSWGLYVLYSTTAADRFIFRLYTGPSTYVYVWYDASLTTGWHHVAVVFDNENTPSSDLAALYLDGAEVKTASGVDWGPGLPNSSSPLYLGGYAGVNPAAGWLDETRLSSTVRYAGAYTVPTSRFANDASTVGLWHFDDTACATSFADASGNGNTAIGQNGAMVAVPDAPAPQFVVSAPSSVSEASGSATVTVRRLGDPVPAVGVSYATANGTATAADYAAASGTFQFACGVTSRTFPVTLTNDATTENAETINVTLSAPTGGASLGVPSSAVVTIAKSDQRPDTLVSLSSSSGYIGNNVYNTTGASQTRTTTSPRGGTRSFYVRAYNDGTTTNRLVLKGSASPSGATVTYFVGKTNVTASMRSSAGYTTDLAAGGYRLVRVQVKVLSGATIGSAKSAWVKGSISSDGWRSDLVKATVKVVT